MTSMYVRIRRDDKWQAIEVDQLTDEELDRFFVDLEAATLARWAKALAGWIRDNVGEDPK